MADTSINMFQKQNHFEVYITGYVRGVHGKLSCDIILALLRGKSFRSVM